MIGPADGERAHMQQESFDRPQSLALAERIGAKTQECYRNALMAVLTQEELADASYVEGVCIYQDTGIPVGHAWVETDEGAILDPTAALITEHPVRYFAGDRYSAAKAASFVNRRLPISFAITEGAARAWRDAYAALGLEWPRLLDEDVTGGTSNT